MEFKIIESILHCSNKNDRGVVLINIVSENKQGFFKRQINGAEQENICTPNLDIHQLRVSGGFLKPTNCRISYSSPRYRYLTYNLGQEHCGFKRKD